MKKYISVILLGCGLLTACNNANKTYPFQPKLLPQEVFDGYWAMLPNQGVYNTVHFKRDGTATLYRFTCTSPTEFVEKEKEHYKLETIGKNKLYFHWEGAFHINRLFLKYFEMTFVDQLDKGKFFKMEQYVPSPINQRYDLVYAKVDTPKPLCSFPKLEEKTQKISKK